MIEITSTEGENQFGKTAVWSGSSIFMSSVQCSQFKGAAESYDPAENNFGPEYVYIISNEQTFQPVDHFV
jgi:hypothetical protein